MLKVLITGGAGFIGTHLTRRLLSERVEVTILDNFSPQVHGNTQGLPADIDGHVRLIHGDVRDRSAVERSVAGQDVVVNLAAETGTGQSMYEVERYEQVNIGGTALLCDILVNTPNRTVSKLVVASSRAIYGEGKYECARDGVVYPGARSKADLDAGRFEPRCPICGEPCRPLPTDELSAQSPSSFYGLTKQVQEQTALLFAKALGISGFALRYQNVYGPGQSLTNPYTGILAIFSQLARSGAPINVFEDGEESRDFVYIDDVVDATWRCIQPQAQGVEAINVGSGDRVSVNEVVAHIARYFESASAITVTGAYRIGDIRHNLASLDKARRILGYEPGRRFEVGIRSFLNWAAAGEAEGPEGYLRSLREMREKGLFHGEGVTAK